MAIQEFRELALGLLQLAARFLQLLGEELRGVPRRLDLLVELLRDERLGDRVRGARGEVGIPAVEGDLHQARAADRLHAQAAEEGAGQRRGDGEVLDGLRGGWWRHRNPADQPLAHRRLRPLVEGFRRLDELRVLVELEQADDAIGQRAALENPVLGLIVVLLGILLDDLLEFDDARLVLLDAKRRARTVDGTRAEGRHRDGDHQHEEGGDDRPAPAADDTPVVPEVGRLLGRVAVAVEDVLGARAVQRVVAGRQRSGLSLGRQGRADHMSPTLAPTPNLKNSRIP